MKLEKLTLDEVKARMSRFGVTRVELAEACGCSERTIYNYLSGHETTASLRAFVRLLLLVDPASGKPLLRRMPGPGLAAATAAQLDDVAARADMTRVELLQVIADQWLGQFDAEGGA